MHDDTFDMNLEENQLKYMSAMASSAHTYGNLLATAQKFFLELFPDDLFKTIHVSSRMANTQILSTPAQFLKKSKPMIIFRPRMDYDEDVFLGKTMMTERQGGGPINSLSPGTVDLNPFLYDQDRYIDVQFSQCRRVMYLDIVMIFATLIQQMNYMDYLNAQLVVGKPFDIETFLESLIPESFVNKLSELSGIPVHDKTDNSVTEFLEYLNNHSIYPVTYKLAGATGKEEFYRYYPTSILTEVKNMDKDDGESTNQVMTSYRITMSVRMEFWAPSITYLFSPKIKDMRSTEVPNDSMLIPIYADVFNYDDMHLAPGWSIYSHASYQLDNPNDVVDITPILAESIIKTMEYHIKNGIPLVNFIDIKVRKQGDLLQPGYDYTIDYDNRTVNFINQRGYTFYTYTIVIGIDSGYINTLIKEIYHLE